jgi:plastocyanin
MRTNTSTYSAFAAIVLGLAALLLSVLSLPSTGRAPAPAAGTAPATLDIDLVITGLGAAGEPGQHHYYNPSMIVARKGDTLRIRFSNLTFNTHGIEFEGYGARTRPLPGGPKGQETITFVADKPGVFQFKCYVPFNPAAGECSPDHATQIGYLVVLDTPR